MFTIATTPVEFEACIDDNNTEIAEARHRTGPMNWKGPYRNMPLVHRDVVTHRDLTHIGVPTRDTR